MAFLIFFGPGNPDKCGQQGYLIGQRWVRGIEQDLPPNPWEKIGIS
jgi:hypothetical protein